jgi:spore coat protein U-like protein
MSAASGGYLTSTTTSDKIQYMLTIDGASKTLGPDIIIDQETAKQLYSKVLLGAISVAAGQDVEAGQYSDTISFTISAN